MMAVRDNSSRTAVNAQPVDGSEIVDRICTAQEPSTKATQVHKYEVETEVSDISVMELHSQESVLLSAALVSKVAAEAAVRILLIKGPAAVQVGSRRIGDSSDLDLLVEPGGNQRIVRGLSERGWKERANTDEDGHPIHSLTMFHDNWPTDIDIHFSYPGFDTEIDEYFAVLWEHRQQFIMASKTVIGLDLTCSTMIQALHALREPTVAKNIAELDFLIREAKKPRWDEIYKVAKDTGALAALKPYLEAAYSEAREVSFPPVSAQWVHRTMVSSPGVHRLLNLSDAPWRHRLKLIVRGIFPADQLLEGNNLELIDATRLEVIRARLARWVTFLVALPSVLREYRSVKAARAQRR